MMAQPADTETTTTPSTLSSRYLSPRTLISILIAFVIVAVAIWRAPVNWGATWDNMRHAVIGFYLCGLFVYYSSFVFRGLRWELLLDNAGDSHRARDLSPILVTSFFVNCVVPAKMGDVYRAYLGRSKLGISATKALGTIIAERLVDLCVLMALLLISGAYVFHRHAPGVLIPYIIAGGALCLLGIAVIAVMRAGRGTRILALLPEAIFTRYERFRLGAVQSLGRWPWLIGYTVLIWGLEGARLGFVVFSLGYQQQVGPSQFLLVALIAALLTTVPFLPGGLGLVEAGMTTALITIAGLDPVAALSIALLDRSISYGSLVVLGFAVFAFTHIHMPGHQPAVEKVQT